MLDKPILQAVLHKEDVGLLHVLIVVETTQLIVLMSREVRQV